MYNLTDKKVVVFYEKDKKEFTKGTYGLEDFLLELAKNKIKPEKDCHHIVFLDSISANLGVLGGVIVSVGFLCEKCEKRFNMEFKCRIGDLYINIGDKLEDMF